LGGERRPHFWERSLPNRKGGENHFREEDMASTLGKKFIRTGKVLTYSLRKSGNTSNGGLLRPGEKKNTQLRDRLSSSRGGNMPS